MQATTPTIRTLRWTASAVFFAVALSLTPMSSLAGPAAQEELPTPTTEDYPGGTEVTPTETETPLSATATPVDHEGHTETPPPTPESSASPEPSSTAAPTQPASPVLAVAIPGTPYPEAPLCEDHDPREVHSLWNAEVGCHYDHHHGDDPHSVDDIFGTEYYDWAGGSISYPWQTVNAQTGCLENDCKHTGYIWLVRRDQKCSSAFTNGCVVAFRALVHAMSSAHDSVVRFHSAWLEAQVCREDRPDICGIFRSGGWQDTGDLLIDRVRVIDYPDNINRFKLHYVQRGNSHFGTWYSASPGGESLRGGMWSVTVELGDMWGPLDPKDPHRLQFYCDDPDDKCSWNGSRYQPHVIGVAFPPRFRSIVDPDRDGMADYDGYADRWGMPVQGCGEISLDCVPLVIENVPVRYSYQGRFDYREYDVLFGRKTSGWLRYPH